MGASAIVASVSACSLVSLDGLSGVNDSQSDGGGVVDQVSLSDDGAADGMRASSDGGGAGQDSGDGHPSPDATANDGQAMRDAAAEDSGQSNDGGSPGAGPDGAEPQDTGTTREAEASAPPVGFCAGLTPTPLFCDDFDEGTPIAAPWDQLSTTGGAETVSGASFVSSPDSMLVAVTPNQSVSSIDLAGYKSFNSKQGATGTATLTFEIRIDAADTSSASDAILGAIQLWNGSAYYDLELEVFYVSSTNDFQVSMSEYGSTSTYTEHVVTPHIPFATWTKVAIGVTLPASGGGTAPATLSLNGATAASITAHVTTSDPIPEILVGTTFATPTAGGWSIAYDNVTFDEP